MTWEPVKIILIVVMVFSAIAMINHVNAKEKAPSIIYNPLKIADYIRITKIEQGHIGWCFWSFLASIIFIALIELTDILTRR